MNPTHTFKPGTYAVQLTASNLCNVAMVKQIVTVSGGKIHIQVAFKGSFSDLKF